MSEPTPISPVRTRRKLPPELVSLVHHIELHKSGWWDKALHRLILGAIWLKGSTPTIQEIADELNEFSVSMNLDDLTRHLTNLCHSGTVVPLGNQFKISEHSLVTMEKCFQDTQELEVVVKSKFIALAKERCPQLDPEAFWNRFNSDFLFPLVQDLGARIYEMISGSISFFDRGPLQQVVECYPADSRESARKLIIDFLDPKDSPVRAFVLRYLNAYFFTEASQLSEDTVKMLTKATKNKPRFDLFLDTNVLFSVLDLDEKTASETAHALLNLIGNLKGIDIRLYVLRQTVDETRTSLISKIEIFKEMRLTIGLAEAALKMGLGGLARRYFEFTATHGPISPEEYFGPYVHNLIEFIREKGVQIYNEDTNKYSQNREVMEDIAEQDANEKQLEAKMGRAKHRAKSYERISHDVKLWHVVKDRRPNKIDNAIEAQSWVVTIDHGVLRFDTFKRKGSGIPIGCDPSALMHMLQFWLPKTAKFEEAILATIRLPFLFQEFDSGAEKVTLDILRSLSRFENIDSLPREAISRILIDTALRNKLIVQQDRIKQDQLIKDAIIEQSKVAAAALKLEREKSESLNQKLEELDRKFGLKQQSEIAMADRIRGLEEELRRNRELKAEQVVKSKFMQRWIKLPAISIVIASLVSGIVLNNFFPFTDVWVLSLIVFCTMSLAWLPLMDYRGRKVAVISREPFFVFFRRFRMFIYTLLVMPIFNNLISDFLYEQFRNTFGF